MRHAKAARPPGTPDRHRPLAERGRRDARSIGAALARLGTVPTVVISSPATRALDTAEGVIAGAGWNLRPELRENLYGGGVDDVLSVIRSADAEVLLAVGHQPTWAATVFAIAGATIPMPTATVAAVEFATTGGPPGSGLLLWTIDPQRLDPGSP